MLYDVLKDISKNVPDIHKFTSINRGIAVAEAYAIVYGLMRPSDPNPLSLICDTPMEGLDELSGWDLRIDQYSRLRIGDNFKMSLLEFINLPRRMITKLIYSAEALEIAELKQQKINDEKRERELAQMNGQLPNGFSHTVPKIK
jgi:hypothetical protein